MIHDAPVLAFLKDNIDQILFGVGGLVLSILFGAGFDLLRKRLTPGGEEPS